jgi:hypothetical protein
MSSPAWWPSVRDELEQFDEWRESSSSSHAGIHLAVFVEPFLTYVLDRSKTVESRFSTTRTAPYRSVEPGDQILLKSAGGPVVAFARVQRTLYLAHPREDHLQEVRTRFGPQMRDDVPGFWAARERASYVSLFCLGPVHTLPSPVSCAKKDRRGWVVLSSAGRQRTLFGDDTARDRRCWGNRQWED